MPSLQSKPTENQSSCETEKTRATGGTNFDLKRSAFIPVAGILELVNRTLVNGVSLLTWRREEMGNRTTIREAGDTAV